jgi:predicted RNase H-like nuclease (RuvC/YqgF family)
MKALAAANAEVYQARTAVNQLGKQLEAAHEAITIPPNVDVVPPVSTADLIAERNARVDTVRRKQAMREELRDLEDQLKAQKEECNELARRLATCRKAISDLEARVSHQRTTVANLIDPTFDDIEARIRDSDRLNHLAADIQRKRDLAAGLAANKARADDLTSKLTAIQACKEDLMAQTIFPIVGLDFSSEAHLTEERDVRV